MRETWLRGEQALLKPTTPEEIPQVFAWATNPDPEVQRYFHGEKIPTYEEFLKEWELHYFDGSQPMRGRCYIILAGDTIPIGMVNYNEFDAEGKRVTLDIIIGRRENLGRGYGSDALRTLVRYLFATFSTLEEAIIGADPANGRAIRAYEKAGFRRTTVDVSDPYIAEYDENAAGLTFLEHRRQNLEP